MLGSAVFEVWIEVDNGLDFGADVPAISVALASFVADAQLLSAEY